MATLSECLNVAMKDGYVENFKVNSEELLSADGKRRFKPNEVGIPNFYRFEGYSDPEDNCILYLIETTDGTKGTLIDAYGSDADPKISSFIRKVDDIKKQESENAE
jgi:hypothetical protein